MEFTSHTVVVVDASGSMRKNDVAGYATRTEAVYESLASEFIAPQLAAQKKGGVEKAVVSLIEMSNESEVSGVRSHRR